MKELEDYHWFPSFLRNFQTEFIGFIVTAFDLYGVFIKHIQSRCPPQKTMMDLCSGSGFPAVSIFEKSNCFNNLILSDKFPIAQKVNNENKSYEVIHADVTEIDFQAEVCYTMFNAFHHFDDTTKKAIIERIKSSHAKAFIVEILEPTLFCFLKIAFTTTVGVLFLTPFVKPFSLKRLFYTYIIPINIITILYDGIVSVGKSRTVNNYTSLLAEHKNSLSVFELNHRFHKLIVIEVNSRL